MNKEIKSVLSVQVDKISIIQLKEICKKEKRSQAKTIEMLIQKDYERLQKIID